MCITNLENLIGLTGLTTMIQFNSELEITENKIWLDFGNIFFDIWSNPIVAIFLGRFPFFSSIFVFCIFIYTIRTGTTQVLKFFLSVKPRPFFINIHIEHLAFPNFNQINTGIIYKRTTQINVGNSIPEIITAKYQSKYKLSSVEERLKDGQ